MKTLTAIALAATMLLSSCASMFSTNIYKVQIDSKPSGLDYTILDARKQVVKTGKTPDVAELTSGKNATAAEYLVEVKDGNNATASQTVSATIDGCFWINIALLPLFVEGMIIDAYTGAAWKLPKQVQIDMPYSR